MRHKLFERMGTFAIKKSDLDALPDWLQQLMARVIVIKADFSFREDGVEYIALSPEFERIGLNEVPVRYSPLINEGRFLRWENGR